ncbi:MAG: transposase [Sulfuricellaceae bacterium]
MPLHLIQRGNNRQAYFFADEDYHFYLDWLAEHAGKTGCQIHSYVLMTNHVHLLLSAETAQAVGALMKALGQRYVQYVSRTYRRSGTLWEGRFRSCPAQDEMYTLRGHDLRIYPSSRGRGFRVANCLCGTATRRNLRSNHIPRDAAKSANCGRAKYNLPVLPRPNADHRLHQRFRQRETDSEPHRRINRTA